MNILLTGDDGYNSIGTRILIHLLKKDHDLTIVGVKNQQSGVGGKLSLREGGFWGETRIDGIQAFWVDGTPADSMEFAHSKLGNHFDWILSGINLGENVTSAIISSGTVGAAIRGLTLGVASHAIALSWETPAEYYFLKHDENEDISTYLEHPGENAEQAIRYCLEHNNLNTDFLNINIPMKVAHKARFTTLFPDSSKLYPPIVVREDGTFAYPPEVSKANGVASETDLGALKEGTVSISPLSIDWTNTPVLETIEKKEITL
jgi:5'-nucleotidase